MAVGHGDDRGARALPREQPFGHARLSMRRRFPPVAMQAVVVSVLLMLSLILMTTTVFPGVDVAMLVLVLGAALLVGLIAGGLVALRASAGDSGGGAA